MAWRQAIPIVFLSLAALVLFASVAAAATCEPSASAVRQERAGSWPSWTLRAPGHEGSKCWFPATRAARNETTREYRARPGAPTRQPVPLPEPELLEPPQAPDCEFKSTVQADNDAVRRAMKLDYEQQCYRQSEFILRARMERLQDAVRKAIGSLKGERTSTTALSTRPPARAP